jgi:hypothetical protein
MTAGIQGLRLAAKANPSRETLEDMVGVALECLD